jgi:hypothetical protein
MIRFALNSVKIAVATSSGLLADGLSLGGENLFDRAVNLSEILRPFALTFIGICLLYELGSVAMKMDMVKWEMVLRVLVKLGISRAFIDLAPNLLRAIYSQTASWIEQAANSAMGGTDADKQLDEQLKNINVLFENFSGLWNAIALMIGSMIIIVAVLACGLIIQMMAYGRIFELCVYIAIAPIPCAFLPLGNGDGTGWSRITAKFFRGFAAVCLQGFMMILCLKVFGLLLEAVIASGAAMEGEGIIKILGFLFMMLMPCIALVMAITKCSGWAKSILDA